MSWVIIHKESKKAILETYSDEYATKWNLKKGYEAIPAMRYLQGLNNGEYSKSK